MRSEPVEVKVGQVWRRKTADGLRTYHVLEITGGIRNRAWQEPMARCHVVETGAKVCVALRRLPSGSDARGFRLVVSDAPAAFALESPT